MFYNSPPQSPSGRSRGLSLRRLALAGMAAAFSISLLGAFASTGEAQYKPDNKAKTNKKSNRSANAEEEKPKRVVLVFPPDATAPASTEASGPDTFKPEQLADIVVEVIQGRLRTSGDYRSIYYSRSLPTIKRAVNEQTLSAADASRPFAQDEKVKRLADLSGQDMVIVTSIDDYQYDADKNQVSLVMSARLLDFKGGVKKVVATAGESLTGPEAPRTKKEVDVAVDTARRLTETLMAQLLRPAKPAGQGAGQSADDQPKP